MADWVKGGPEPALGLSHTANTAALNLASYLSMVQGDRIDLPLESAYDEWPVEELARRRAPVSL